VKKDRAEIEELLARLTPQRRQLVHDHMYLAKASAQRLHRDGSPIARADLEQIGHLELLRAAANHRGERDGAFEGYAWSYVYWAQVRATKGERRFRNEARALVVDYLAGETSGPALMQEDAPSPRELLRARARRAALDLTLRAASSEDESADPETRLIRERRHHAVREAIAKLEERAREVIAMRYHDGLTFGDIQERLDISYNTGRRIHEAALAQLRYQLAAHAGDEG
jgi:RNA polymerase sigma factor (sigma-70 family)